MGGGALQIVDKTKYDPGDDRLQHEIDVLLKVYPSYVLPIVRTWTWN